MRVDVKLDRCTCIHSLSQVVDIALQVILYQRQIIPEPVQFLLSCGDGQKTEKFCTVYNDVKEVIRQSFRHQNSRLLNEFVIVIGNTPYLPKEIYRIPISICLNHLINANCSSSSNTVDSDADGCGILENNSGCGEHCAILTHREKRQIFSSLALSKTVQNLLNNSVLCANDKVFFFMNSKPNVYFGELAGLEEDGFELPSEELRRRRNICQLVVQVKQAPCPLINEQYGNDLLKVIDSNKPVDNNKETAVPSTSSTLASPIGKMEQRQPELNESINSPPKRKRLSFSSDENECFENDDGYSQSFVVEKKEDNLWFRILQYFVRL